MSADPRLLELFGEAIELDGEARAAWLRQLVAREPGLGREIAALLAAGERRGTLLDTPPLAGLGATAAVSEPLPERVGAYRILRELGHGGMGRVFLAEEEGEHFRRRVALKVIERGDLAPAAVHRFRDEVRILASLEHPGIARFLDGGRSAEGVWFLALEYVEGAGLLEHAHAQALDVEQRVRLFRDVLAPVAHAHRQHVVHRDLKPANVVVGTDGRPRLLDFGISKLLEPEDDDPGVTRTELRAFTPAYASPEQFRGDRATTASDVYSLGVVLYELLAGVRPHGGSATSRAELERAVLEEDPQPPSAAARRRFGRDLDAICLKALRKEPRERYASATELDDDLARFLDGRPVLARRGGLRYRTARFAGRHRGALATTAALAIAAAALSVAVRSQWHRPVTPEIAEVVPSAPPPRPFPFSAGNVPPIEELERRWSASPASVETGAALALALERADRRSEAALVVTRLRQIPGRAADPLIDYVEASVAMRADQPQRALVLYTTALERATAGGRGELVAQIRASRGRLLSTLGRREEAIRDMESARADFERANDLASLARVLNDLAIEEAQKGRLAAAETLFEQALAATRRATPPNYGSNFLMNLGLIAAQRGHPDVGALRLRDAVTALRKDGRPRRLGYALGEYAGVLHDLGRARDARAAIDEAVALLRAAGDEKALASRLVYVGTFDVEAARLDKVGATAEEIERLARAGADRVTLGWATVLRGRLAGARGDVATARGQLAEGSRLLRANGERDYAQQIDLLRADLEREAGDLRAAALLAEAILAEQVTGEETAVGIECQALLARVAANEAHADAARERLGGIAAAAEKSASVDLRLGFLAARAELAVAERRFDEARADLAAAVALAVPAERTLAARDLRRRLAALSRG